MLSIMYRRQRPSGYYGRGRQPFGYGRHGGDYVAQQLLMYLLTQIWRLEHKPPMTIAIVALNVFMFFYKDAPGVRYACLKPSAILGRRKKEFSRIGLSAITHADEYHLYYNMVSLIIKGSQLEPVYGSAQFLLLCVELTVTSGWLYVLTAYLCRMSAWNDCAVGFSAVLFGLKVILTHDSPGYSVIAGYRVPTKFAAWAELVVIQMVTPNASFLGHACGIVAGLIHVYFSRYIFQVYGPSRGRQR